LLLHYNHTSFSSLTLRYGGGFGDAGGNVFGIEMSGRLNFAAHVSLARAIMEALALPVDDIVVVVGDVFFATLAGGKVAAGT